MNIFVAGGSRGIGRAVAEGFADEGNHVVINYFGAPEEAADAADAVRARGAEVTLIEGDLASPEGAGAVMEQAAGAVEFIDLMVHCPVLTVSGPILEADPVKFNAAVQVNAMSLLYTVQAALPLVVDGTSIVYLSSRGSRVAMKDYASVGAPKAFAEAMIRYMAVELAPRGARINVVSPTAQDTAAFRSVFPNDYKERLEAAARNSPSGRAVGLDDIVGCIKFLASPESSMIQGQVMIVDGGNGFVA